MYIYLWCNPVQSEAEDHPVVEYIKLRVSETYYYCNSIIYREKEILAFTSKLNGSKKDLSFGCVVSDYYYTTERL